MIRTVPDLKAAVAEISEHPAYVVDVETIGKPDGLNHLTNSVTWVGLCTDGFACVIPLGHTLGKILVPERKEKVVPENPKWLPKSNRYSNAKTATLTIPAVHADPGPQLEPAQAFKVMEPLFFSDQLKIGHNVKFDVMSVAKYYRGRLPVRPYLDTMLMQHVVDENRIKYDLKTTTLDWLRIPLAQRKTYYPNLGKDHYLHPIDKVARYVLRDVRYTWFLYKRLQRLVEREGQESVLAMEMALYPSIMSMEMAGTMLDREAMHEIRKRLEKSLDELKMQAWNMTLEPDPFDLTNVNKKRELLFGPKPRGRALKPLARTPKTDQAVLDQTVLEHYAARGDALAKVFLAWSEQQKVLSTYIEGMEKRMHKGKVHTSFTQHGTVTGRLSSRTPNLQNIPRESEIRALFIAPEGYRLVVADYDQIELRVTAHYSKDPLMVSVFERGMDIHASTAAAVLGKDPGDVTKEERQIGKGLNFAVVYGAGPQKVATMSGRSIREAEEFLDEYYKQFSAIRPWKHYELRRAMRRGDQHDPRRYPPYVTTMFGRKRRLPDLYSNDGGERSKAQRQAINTIVQGSAAEIMKLGMIRLHKAFEAIPDKPFQMVLTVHDELLSLAPEDRAEECQALVIEAMSGVRYSGKSVLDVPLIVSCGIASRWSEAK